VDGRQVLVLYSLGNLLSDQWMLEDALRSALVKLTFHDDQIVNIEIIPIMMDRATKSLQEVVEQQTRDQIAERLKVDQLSMKNVGVSVR